MRKKILIVSIAIAVILIIIIARDASEISGSTIEENKVLLKGKGYRLEYLSAEKLRPFFGRATSTGEIQVSSDLPLDAQNFVLHHELFHLQDNRHKNVISREIHANLAALPYDPVGFIKVIYLSLTNRERFGYYGHLIGF